MAEIACPKCGGRNHRTLAPGYFECNSSVVAGVVPPGVVGNPIPHPVTAQCGHRFQVGTATATPACRCGMFSVGLCAECGKPVCGHHGAHDAGRFLCVEDLREIRARRSEERERAEREAAESRAVAAREQEERERAARERELPGFPEAPATFGDVAAALQVLVPERVGTYRLYGFFARVHGWGFPSFWDRRWHGYVITTEGEAYYYMHQAECENDLGVRRPGCHEMNWSPRLCRFPPERHRAKPATTQLGDVMLRTLRNQVLEWRGLPSNPQPGLLFNIHS